MVYVLIFEIGSTHVELFSFQNHFWVSNNKKKRSPKINRILMLKSLEKKKHNHHLNDFHY